MDSQPGKITDLLKRWSEGEEEALAMVMTELYGELRRMAGNFLTKERHNHTLQPTALVNELYLRMLLKQDITWDNRTHFFSVSAQTMRNVLIDYARRKSADKRAGQICELFADDVPYLADQTEEKLIALDDALKTLAKLNPTHSKIVDLRFFGGFSVEETAELLGVSTRTVLRGWGLAKAWLYQEMNKADKR